MSLLKDIANREVGKGNNWNSDVRLFIDLVRHRSSQLSKYGCPACQALLTMLERMFAGGEGDLMKYLFEMLKKEIGHYAQIPCLNMDVHFFESVEEYLKKYRKKYGQKHPLKKKKKMQDYTRICRNVTGMHNCGGTLL